jgi:hypothetical protein
LAYPYFLFAFVSNLILLLVDEDSLVIKQKANWEYEIAFKAIRKVRFLFILVKFYFLCFYISVVAQL